MTSPLGSPMQIIDIEMKQKGRSRMNLDRGVLWAILQQVENRKIVLISIAGPSRMGKSFLLSFILRRLNSLQNNEEENWIGAKDKPLIGFPFKNGIDHLTSGIWLWSKPFIIKKDDGTELAVLVMDTQGVFDEHTTQREWSSIVGITLLTSSCLIYNLSHHLQEDSLQVLNNFMQYGMLAMEESESDERCFERLVFLIRDWNNPDDFDYGPCGGKAFLTQKLEIKPHLPPQSQEVRSSLKKCFKDIDCFLLPDPGQSAKSNTFEGKLEELEERFSKKMKEFITELINPDEIPIKLFRAKPITADELNKLFRRYVQLFNENEFPTPMSVMEATAHAANDAKANACLESYKSEMASSQDSKEFLSKEELVMFHETNEKVAIATFEKTKKFGDKKIAAQYLRKLKAEIQSSFQSLCITNKSKREKCAKIAIHAATETYNSRMTACVGTNFVVPQQFNNISTNIKQEAVDVFNKMCGQSDTNFFDEYFPTLKSSLDTLEQVFNSGNEQRQIEFNRINMDAVSNALELYNQKMEIVLMQLAMTGNVIKDDVLNQLHHTNQEKALKTFRGDTQSTHQAISAHFENLLLQELNSALLKIASETTEKQNQYEMEIQNARDTSLKLYNENVKTEMSRYDVDSINLNEFHNTSRKAAEDYFEQHCGINSVHLLNQHKRKLSKEISECLKTISAELENVIETRNKIILKAEEETTKLYGDQMTKELARKIMLSENELKNVHEKQRRKCVEHLENCTELTQKSRNESVSRVEAKIDVEFQNFIKEYEIRRQQSKACSENALLDAKRIYTHEMEKSIQTAKSEMVLKEAHKLVHDRIAKSFKEQLNDVIDEEKTEFLNRFTNDVVHTFQMFRDEFNSKKQADLMELKTQMNAALDSYKDEMRMHCDGRFVRPTQMEIFHSKSRSHALLLAKRKVNKNDEGCFELLENLKSDIKNEYACIERSNSDHKINSEKTATDLTSKILEDFEQRMRACTDHCRSEKAIDLEFNNLQRSCRLDCVSICAQIENEFKELLIQKLEKQMQRIYKESLSEFASKRKILDHKQSSTLIDAEKYYGSELLKLLVDKPFCSQGQLKEHHEIASRKTKAHISNLEIAVEGMFDTQALNAVLSKCFTTAQRNNESGRRKAEEVTKKLIKDSENKYRTEIEARAKVMESDADLNSVHEEIKTSITDNLKSDCPLPESEQYKYLEILERNLNDAYRDISLSVSTKKKLFVTESKHAKLDGRKYYEEEMLKQTKGELFIDPGTLEKWHNKAKSDTLKKFKSGLEKSGDSKSELLHMIELAYTKFKETNAMNTPTNPAIGIDLGTTFSCVAVYMNGKTVVIPNELKKNTTPSYVAFKNNTELVGNAAKDQAHEIPQSTIFDAKRLIGRRFDDPVVQKDMHLWPFKLVQEAGIPKIEVNGRTYHPEEISSKILKKMKDIAEKHLKCKVTNAVITVPAYFNDGQRQATKDAGVLAGLNVLRIINEPSAAAFAFSLERMDVSKRHVLIFDFGGGTFDISILCMNEGSIETLAVHGDTHLGGEDFDSNMVEYCVQEFKKQHNIDLFEGRNSSNPTTKNITMRKLRRLRNDCEKQKINLSGGETTKVTLDAIHEDLDLNVTITRTKFEEMNANLLQKSIDLVQAALDEAKLQKSQIDDIVLVGGSTRIPKVQKLLTDFFDGKPLNKIVNPDEAVACGAAIQAAILNGNLAQQSGVALGKNVNNMKLTDVTPYSYGIEVFEGDLSVIIPKNSKVPTSKTETYLTAYNNQTSVLIVIYEGEKKKAIENNKVGEFFLNGIPPANAEQQKIEVTMSINDEGILHVTAVCNTSGVMKDLVIREHKGRLSGKELKSLVEAGP